MNLLFPPGNCPLCGNTNACAMAELERTGEAQAPCWCMTSAFPAALLARVPAEAQRAACICQRCVDAAQSEASSSSSV